MGKKLDKTKQGLEILSGIGTVATVIGQLLGGKK